MIQWLILGGVMLVAILLAACWAGEVFGLNGRLDAADEENEDWCWPHRIDQRRD